MSEAKAGALHRFNLALPDPMLAAVETVGDQTGKSAIGIIRDALKFRARLSNSGNHSPIVKVGETSIDSRLVLAAYQGADRKLNTVVPVVELQEVSTNADRLSQTKSHYMRESLALWLKMIEENDRQKVDPNGLGLGIFCEVNDRSLLIIT